MPKKLKSFKSVYYKIRQIIDHARQNVYRSVNYTMVKAYWNIGRLLVENEQKGNRRAEYGRNLINGLSKRLTNEFGKGFDDTNLWNMRQFYLCFPILDAVRQELTWTHYRLLMRLENETARSFYLEEALLNNWSTRQLERQIYSLYFERTLSSKNMRTTSKRNKKQKKHIYIENLIKDPYILEFLNLKDNTSLHEVELEKGLINKLQAFLLELGKGFCFVARQQRISSELQNFYIDLVFYNYLLKCFVLIDLKVGKLTHQDIGQMDMYVKLYEDKVKPEGNNPTIGIILCSEKDETVVKYSVLKESNQLFASKYRLYLPTEEELKIELDRERNMIETESKLL